MSTFHSHGENPQGSSPSISNNANSRSFWFLLTLALEKAKIAVEHDNQGRIPEAIKLYQDSINLLGVVFHRTQEEDHKSRLRHFRETYSERIAVLQSAPQQNQESQSSSVENAATRLKTSTSGSDENNAIPSVDTDLQSQFPNNGSQATSTHSPRSGGDDSKHPITPQSTKIAVSRDESGNANKGSGLSFEYRPLHKEQKPQSNRTSISISTTEHRKSQSLEYPPLVHDVDARSMKTQSFHSDEDIRPSFDDPGYTDSLVFDMSKLATHYSGSESEIQKSSQPELTLSPLNTTPLPAGVRSEMEQYDRVIVDGSNMEHEGDNQSRNLRSQKSLPALLGSNHLSPISIPQGEAIPTIPDYLKSAQSYSQTNSESASTQNLHESRNSYQDRLNGSKNGLSRGFGRKILESIRPSASRTSPSITSPSSYGFSNEYSSDHGEVPESPAVNVSNSSGGVSNLKTRVKIMDLKQSALASTSSLGKMDNVPISRPRSKTIDTSLDPELKHDSQQSADKLVPMRNTVRSLSESTTNQPNTTGMNHTESLDQIVKPSKHAAPSNVAKIRDWFQSGGQTQPSSSSSQKDAPIKPSGSSSKLANLFRRKQSIPNLSEEGRKGSDMYSADNARYQGIPNLQTLSLSSVVSRQPTLLSSASTPMLSEPPQHLSHAELPPLPTSVTNSQQKTSPTRRRRMSIISNDSTSNDLNDLAKSSSVSSIKECLGQPKSDSLKADDVSSIESEENRPLGDDDDDADEKEYDTSEMKDIYHKALSVDMKEDKSSLADSILRDDNIDNDGMISLAEPDESLGYLQQKTPKLADECSTANILNPKPKPIPKYATSQQQLVFNPRITIDDVEADILDAVAEYQEDGMTGAYQQPTRSPASLYPFWKMRTLLSSMVKSGAYITPSLYIPRRMWFQVEIRVYAVEAKMVAIDQLVDVLSHASNLRVPEINMEHLSIADSPVRKGELDQLLKACNDVSRWLDDVEKVFDQVRKNLSKKLKFISPVHSSSSVSHQRQRSTTLLGAGSQSPKPDEASSFGGNPSAATRVQGQHRGSNGALTAGFGWNDGSTAVDREASLEDNAKENRPSNPTIHNMASSQSLANAQGRFRGFGKLGKSVDKLYSNMQKDKVDNTKEYSFALNRLFSAFLQIEGWYTYFSTLAYHQEIIDYFPNSVKASSSFDQRSSTATEQQDNHSHSDKQSRKAKRRSVYFLPSKTSNISSHPPPPPLPAIASTPVVSESDNAGIESNCNSDPSVQPPQSSVPQQSSGNKSSFSTGQRTGTRWAAEAATNGSPAAIYARLVRLSEWSDQVVVAWVIRDVQVMLGKYTRRLRESITD
ncbi:hypothetical protein H4219_003981 [Mycoemilia scoparia]|uniref:MIT domain-containing protein n=1 Tax=Mycoemilia scoparia TaxID=417184 RepID=A0A9W8DSK7_9FUNG|nr:hypothetical protein H4219_003981 [Mycoemilia scoparia]